MLLQSGLGDPAVMNTSVADAGRCNPLHEATDAVNGGKDIRGYYSA